MDIFKNYINSLRTFRISEITESTYRNKLQDLLETIAEEINPQIRIIHEPKREGRFGSPDYKVIVADSIIGYVENKPIGEDLERVLKSEQIERYKSLSDNLIITNYIEFIWLKDGNVIKRENLSYLTDFERKKIKIDLSRAQAVKKLITNFFSQAPKGISSSNKLAKALSIRARLLKDFLYDELKRQQEEHKEGKLYGLFQTFKKYVFNELSVSEFSDTFAQNLVYGLFLAKLNAGASTVSLYNAKKYISHSFELIKELVGFLDELENEEYKETRWIVEEVLTVMHNLDLKAIAKSLSFDSVQKDNKFKVRDPYIYFYEDFLATYDKKLRKSKGVYYTPPQIVNFIIRSIDDILINVFNLENGFSDYNKVTVLDFATGTATFLIEILDSILNKLPKNSGKKELIVREHILKNIYGFEYLVAPYTIAHLKLSQYLKNQGYILSENERFQIYLTNTLEPVDKQLKISLLPALASETNLAQKVKEKPILVITGNPPYSGHSKNTGKWITDKIKDYYKVDGESLKEKNTKWLLDDYVKFIRFAQDKMDKIEEGVIGIITSHSYLDNPTFRGMRQSLLKTFNQIYILDLHGNSKRKEKTPTGEKDENVFDIEQGVAISIMIKKKGLKKEVFHSDLWGSRNYKYKECLEKDLQSIKWNVITPNKPYYLFKNYDVKILEEYKDFISLKNIFNISGTGIMTKRDKACIFQNKTDLSKFIEDLRNITVEDLRKKYSLGKDSRDWSINRSINEVKRVNSPVDFYKKVHYRPFDIRWTFYTNKSRAFMAYPVYEIGKHFIELNNYGLICNRTVKIEEFNHAFITKYMPDLHIFETANANAYVFPLFLKSEGLLEDNETKIENLKLDFKQLLNKKYNINFSPEEILSYIYAILYSPSYRDKYRDPLKLDFPKIPFTDDKDIFEKISALGFELIQTHIGNKISNCYLGSFIGKGNNKVETIKHKSNKIFINNEQYFENICREVYEFKIGGYQVLNKYLKDRKGRVLLLREVENIEKIVKILAFTLDQMKKIDDITKDWI